MQSQTSKASHPETPDDQFANVQADWSSAYDITCRPGDDLPFKAVPRGEPGTPLEAATVAGLRAMVSADHARRVAAQPGGLARLTAGILTAAGLDITGPDAAATDAADGDECQLMIAWPGGHCALFVSDHADAQLHWQPPSGDSTDPHHVAGLAAALLSGQAGVPHPGAAAGGNITFKGIVGMDLKASGFKVDLNVYPDDHYYDVTADIAATDPRAAGGTVYVTDDGSLTWLRDYWPEHAAAAWEPEFRAWLPDPAAVARAIADTVSRALTAGPALHTAC